jgi:flagellin-like protein
MAEPTALSPRNERGVSSIIGVLLMVGVVVVMAGTVILYVGDMGDRLHEPSFATVSAEKEVVDFGAEGDCEGTSNELTVDVTLTSYGDADKIYVIVREEGGETKKTVWEDPTGEDVGQTKTLANELDGNRVDIDIGGGGDWAFCPGNSATFTFYARNDGQTTSLQRLEV